MKKWTIRDVFRTVPSWGDTTMEAGANPEPVKRRRILLVEDHADTATIMARLLDRAGYEVETADSVATALAVAAQAAAHGGLDLVVSDIGLSDGSGLELMRELRSRYGLRGIALSGFGMDSDLQRSADAGFEKHLIKPVNPMVLRQTVQELFATG
jgi:CheY-like chemotaxis protein